MIEVSQEYFDISSLEFAKLLANFLLLFVWSLFNTALFSVPPPRDSTIAVAIGASVGGALALLILSMVMVKCLRRRRKQELTSEEKIEEEVKLEAEGVAEERTK